MTPTTPTDAMVRECLELSSNALYTSTTLFVWLRCLRTVRVVFVVAPVVLGSLAGWTLLTKTPSTFLTLVVAAMAFLAGLIPAVYRALKLDTHLTQCAELAAEFKNLQNRFRQCGKVSSLKPFAEFEQEFKALMDRLDAAHRPSYTAPEWCFRRAQKKIQAGHYTPDPLPGD